MPTHVPCKQTITASPVPVHTTLTMTKTDHMKNGSSLASLPSHGMIQKVNQSSSSPITTIPQNRMGMRSVGLPWGQTSITTSASVSMPPKPSSLCEPTTRTRRSPENQSSRRNRVRIDLQRRTIAASHWIPRGAKIDRHLVHHIMRVDRPPKPGLHMRQARVNLPSSKKTNRRTQTNKPGASKHVRKRQVTTRLDPPRGKIRYMNLVSRVMVYSRSASEPSRQELSVSAHNCVR